MAVKGKRWCSVVMWVEVYGWDLKKVFLVSIKKFVFPPPHLTLIAGEFKEGNVVIAFVHLRHGPQNSHRAVSPLVRLVGGEQRWEASEHPQGILPQNWVEPEPNRTVTCMVLKAKTNDRRTTNPLPR
ncbi:hypothetical protein TNCV_2387911 [Trichonephila clavipes]|nr:hypothetical protein TNCV_2387911 [Trichonephila clavipes]